jgi:hypothetical protein
VGPSIGYYIVAGILGAFAFAVCGLILLILSALLVVGW